MKAIDLSDLKLVLNFMQLQENLTLRKKAFFQNLYLKNYTF